MDSYNRIKQVIFIEGKHNLEVDEGTCIIKDTYTLINYT